MTPRNVVLVTGGSGAIGSAILRELAKQGWRRRSLVHRRPVAEADETVAADLADDEALRRAMEGVAAVIHAAAITHSRSPARYEEVNVRGTERLVRAARAAGIDRFVFVSTRANSLNGGAYSRSKRLAEEELRRTLPEATIVRLPEVYGIDSGEGIGAIIRRARDGKPSFVVGRGDDIVCPVHVDDAARACVRALETSTAIGKTYTLAGECVTTREFVTIASEAFSRRARVVAVPTRVVAVLALASRVAPLPLYPDQLARLRAPKSPATPEARTDLQFHARDLREGLAQLAEEHDDN